MRTFFLKLILFIILATLINNSYSQGLNRNYLLGYDGVGLFDTNVTSKKAMLSFDTNNIVLSPDSFAMGFSGEQANISDEQGNLLMYTNGCYIADASHNMMQNGDSLFTGDLRSWCSPNSGLPINKNAVFLPWPGDSNLYVLLHMVIEYDIGPSPTNTDNLLFTIVDIRNNNGLGSVIAKNQIAFNDSICVSLDVCKHANGRDWWIVLFDPYSDLIFTLLLDPSGFTTMPAQHSGLPGPFELAGSSAFSPDGTKLALFNNYIVTGPTGTTRYHELRLLNFDRCNGLFSNPQTFTYLAPNNIGGLSCTFSSNSKYIYFGRFDQLYQINTDTTNIVASIDTIATFDNYCFPYPFECTYFWYTYLAPNGKIYISSGSSTIDMNVINEPNLEGIACDMQQHSLRLPCRISRSHVFHPNYYLGPVIGSVCDSLPHVGLQEHLQEVQNFTVYPNPISKNGGFNISYLLPQNKPGLFEVYDVMGNLIYQLNLPQWSTFQNISIPKLSSGVYYATITSNGSRQVQKILVL
jgi:hypothetical protein